MPALTKEQKAYHKKYYEKNRERIIARKIAAARCEKRRAYERKYKRDRLKNDPKYAAKRRSYLRKWQRDRKAADPSFNMAHRLRSRVRSALAAQGAGKSFKLFEIVGLERKELFDYLVSKFQSGMTVEDFAAGRIHIDHIKPCERFDLTDVEQQRQCFHYTNLQPLWAEDNFKKKSYFPFPLKNC
jgi:hypothetical protein